MARDERPAAEPGCLFLVSTPIGNLEDTTTRSLDVLRRVGAIACEDTRRTLKLLSAFEIPRPGLWFACHDHNEAEAARRIVGLLESGVEVALCSDAGSPLVSDPGYRVVRAVLDAGLPVTAVPGPSAVITALSLSGLPPASFTMLGFLPRRPGRQRRALEAEASRPHTLVLFESPHRVGRLMTLAKEVLGDRRGALCVDLTKRFERVYRGPLSELVEAAAKLDGRGEITLVIEGLGRGEEEEDLAPEADDR